MPSSNTNSDVDVTDYSDSEEPSFSREILSKLATSRNGKLPLATIERLVSLRIKLQHDVPPQHKVETSSGSKTLTAEQKTKFEMYGPLKNGIFVQSEDATIKRNWALFCKVHKWDLRDVKPFLSMKHDGQVHMSKLAERTKFVQFLAKDLPWRTLHSVYYRFKKIYEKPRRSVRYTMDEDEQILSFMKNAKSSGAKGAKHWLELSTILNRDRHSIWSRYMKLQRFDSNTSAEKNVIWTMKLTEKFLKMLIKLTVSTNVKQLKDLMIPKVVWKKMEKHMNIDCEVLKRFWLHQLHMQLFSPQPIYQNEIKEQLLEYLYNKKITNNKEIGWTNVAHCFNGVTTSYLMNVFHSTLKIIILRTKTFSIRDNLHHFCKNKKSYYTGNDKYLPLLVYENGKLSFMEDSDSDSEPELKTKRKRSK